MKDSEKAKKLDILLQYAIMNISPTSLILDREDIWKNIDNIIKIIEHIDRLKKGDEIADE
jgi:hypothetical protein